MKKLNELKMEIEAKSINEAYARVSVGAFIAFLDPGVDEVLDVKSAVSEAVTNAIVHAYRESQGKIYINVIVFDNNKIRIRVRDRGVGIEDIPKAMEPLFTTGGEERAGLGFAVMESFMDKVKVSSKPGKGTLVTLEKQIRGKKF